MELFSFTVADTPLLVSGSESGLFLHPMRNERFVHPFLLCSGYKSGFSGCIYNESLYYTYINKENSLLLRRLHSASLLFRLDGTDTVTYQAPQLISVDSTLFLFYFEAESDSYRLKLRLPFDHTALPLPKALLSSFPELPFLSLQTVGTYVYLLLATEATTLSYRYTKSAGFELLFSESELLSNLRLPWEVEKKQLEQALLQAVRLSEQQQNLLTECEQSRQQAMKKSEQSSLLLERAKDQYNELMQVAERYRQEALKWYGKFTDIH